MRISAEERQRRMREAKRAIDAEEQVDNMATLQKEKENLEK